MEGICILAARELLVNVLLLFELLYECAEDERILKICSEEVSEASMSSSP